MAVLASLRSKKFSAKIVISFIVVLIVLIGVAPGYYFYTQYQKTQKMLESPTDAAKEEVSSVVEKVGALIILPTDEDPTLATVSDSSKLANQAFFANAENGDKVLIYSKQKKAYLYRPSLHKLIDIGPVSIGEQAPPPQPVNIETSITPTAKVSPTLTVAPTLAVKSGTTSTFQKVNVALYNGTKTAGLAATTETALKTKAPFVTVVAKGNSANNYTESLVVDFTGKYKKEAAELVKQLGGSVGILPKGELKPTADILVILGPQ